jgi:DNA repair protein RadC
LGVQFKSDLLSRVHRILQAGKLLCIPVLDSVIIGSNGRYTSLATESVTNEDDEDTLFV